MAKNLEKLKHSIPCSDVHFNWLAQTDQDQDEAKKDCLERCGLFETESSETIGICQEHYSAMYLNFAAFMISKTCNYHLHDSSNQSRQTRGMRMQGTQIPLQKSIELLQFCDKLIPKDSFVCADCVPLINAEIAEGKQRHQQNAAVPVGATQSGGQGSQGSQGQQQNAAVPGGGASQPGQGSQGNQGSQGFDQYRDSQSILGSSSSSEDSDTGGQQSFSLDQVFVYLHRNETINLVGQISNNFQFTSDYSERGIPEGSALGRLVKQYVYLICISISLANFSIAARINEELIVDWTLERVNERLQYLATHRARMLVLDIIPANQLPPNFSKRMLRRVGKILDFLFLHLCNLLKDFLLLLFRRVSCHLLKEKLVIVSNAKN